MTGRVRGGNPKVKPQFATLDAPAVQTATIFASRSAVSETASRARFPTTSKRRSLVPICGS
jgi:hypothetical protein